MKNKDQKFNVKLALKETLDLMKSVYPYLIIGAAIGAVIHGLVPTEWISSVFGRRPLVANPYCRDYWNPFVYSTFQHDTHLTNSHCKRNGIRTCYGDDY